MKRRQAFTLVQMVAATVLAAVLMVTALLVIAGLGRERRIAAASEKLEPSVEMMELIRWDLVNAREMSTNRGQVTLIGFGSLDEDASPRSHVPVEVVYEVQRAADRSWLVRRQRTEDRRGRGEWSVELVCADVARFEVTEVGEKPVPRPRAATTTRPTSAPASRPSVLPTIASCVRVEVAWDDPDREPIEQVLVLR